MKIRLENCDQELRVEFRAAMEFYARKLFNPRIIDKLGFLVQFVPEMRKREKCCGEILPIIEGRNIRKFHIRVASDIPLRSQLSVLAHEMAHAKQYAHGELREIGLSWTRWQKSKVRDDSVPYWDRPWEIDARGWETGLIMQWKQHKKKAGLTNTKTTI